MRPVVRIVVGGIVFGLAAFWLSSWLPPQAHLGPTCATRTIEEAGFDPWTGLGYGRLYECIRDNNGVALPAQFVRDTARRTMFGTRHAVPVPVGIVGGWLTIGSIVAIRARRRR